MSYQIFQGDGVWMDSTRRPPPTLSDTTIRPTFEPSMLSFDLPNRVMNTDLDLKDAPDFVPTAPGAEIPGYESLDPRLIDTRRNIRLVLDRPAQQPAFVQPLCVPPPEASATQPYAGFYPDYQSLTGGNRQYYIDPLLSDAYFEPVYQIPAEVKGAVYQDPMGSLKPYYDRQPILDRNTQLSEYSFDQDQMSFREDIMSKQASGMNRRSFEVFHKYFHTATNR